MNNSKLYDQALSTNIFLKEEYKRNQENFVRRLINAESHLVQNIRELPVTNDQRSKFNSVKTNVKKFHDLERGNEISKQNALLIKNLMEISHGKRGSIPTPQAQQKRSQSSKPKSLNEAVRRKELERIAKENFNMVKRLHQGTSVISKRQHDGDFKNHVKYRKNIQKNTGQAVIGFNNFQQFEQTQSNTSANRTMSRIMPKQQFQAPSDQDYRSVPEQNQIQPLAPAQNAQEVNQTDLNK